MIKYNILRFDEIESTNTFLMENDFPHGTVAVTANQTAGRGRRGRNWLRSGGMLAISVLLRREPAPEFTLVAALACALALESAAREHGVLVNAKIKWANDIIAEDVSETGDGGGNGGGNGNGNDNDREFFNGRKVCGVLCECRGQKIVAGFGVNVNGTRSFFTENGIDGAGFLSENGIVISFATVEKALLREISRFWNVGFAEIRDEYAARCITLGREVKIISLGENGTERFAFAESVDERGRLVCRDSAGGWFTVHSGEVSVRGLSSYF